jgi:hypothetical protein
MMNQSNILIFDNFINDIIKNKKKIDDYIPSVNNSWYTLIFILGRLRLFIREGHFQRSFIHFK